MGIENLFIQATRLFKNLGKSQRLEALNTLDRLVKSGDVGKIRKPPRRLSDGTRSLVAKGKLKDEVHEVLDEVGFVRSDPKISGSLGKKYNTEEGIKIIKETRAKSPKSNYKSKRDPGAQRKYTPNLNSPVERFVKKYLGSDYKQYKEGIEELVEQKLRQIKTKMSKDAVPNYEIIFKESVKTPESMMASYPNLLDEILPFRNKAQNFMEGPYNKLSTSQAYKKQVYDYMKSRGMSEDQIEASFAKSFATLGHKPPVASSYGDFLKTGNKASLQNFEQSATPKFWNPEIGLVNAGKDTPDNWIINAMQDGSMSKEGMRQVQEMYSKLGIESRFRNINVGKQDLNKQADFLDYGSSTGNKLFTGPGEKGTAETKNLFNRMTGTGDISFEEILEQVNKKTYSTGGLVKLLKTLKLTKKQKDLIERTAFSEKNKRETGPKVMREKRIEEKLAKVGAEKKWKYVKSPDNESFVKKKFPYLDPENDAFIIVGESTHPITGSKHLDKFGRYQMSSKTDPSDIKPMQKFSVYDFWDDSSKSIRETPKFKHVTDNKGNIIMKEQFNIGGFVKAAKAVGSLTKGRTATRPVGKISTGQMQLPKPKVKASEDVIETGGIDVTNVRNDLYTDVPKGPYTIANQSGVRALDREFDTIDDARSFVRQMEGDNVVLGGGNTFRIFGARPPKVKGVSVGAPEVGLTKADDARMPAMFWKSREEIANAQQSTMSGQQWLSYLKNKGVGDIELKDTSLGFHLMSNTNSKIKKIELLNEFDAIAPQIEVKMLGLRDPSSTINDALKFVDQTLKSPPLYMDSRTRRILKDVNALTKNMRQSEGTGPAQINQIIDSINKGFKKEFGMDQIIGKGLDPKVKLPFMAKKTALIFDDVLNQGGIKFKPSGKPKHGGDQVMSGGSNYQEMLFSYKPGALRNNEPVYSAGHDFGGARPDNMFAWVRFSDRTDEYGRKLLYVEEIQSDMHAQARAKGTYSTGYAKRYDLFDPDSTKTNEIKTQLANIQGKIDDAEGLNIQNLRSQQNKLLKKAEGLKPSISRYKPGSSIPEGPLADSKDHGRFIMQYLLRAAKESGDYDGVALANAKVKGGEKTGFYDKIMMPQLKKISKKSGASLTETVIVDGKGMPHDNIPVLLLKDKKGIIPMKDISVYNRGGLVG